MKTALAAALIVTSGLMLSPAIAADRAPSRVRVAMDKAGDTITRTAANQPRFTPKAPEAVEEFTAVRALKPIAFAFDKADVRTSENTALDADAAWLKANPSHAILIAGHADQRGDTQYNLALGERRAEAVRDRLVARGVRADRITLASYGEGVPSCRAMTEPCWTTNRHVSILVRALPTPQRP